MRIEVNVMWVGLISTFQVTFVSSGKNDQISVKKNNEGKKNCSGRWYHCVPPAHFQKLSMITRE